jgi:hypothetical protein
MQGLWRDDGVSLVEKMRLAAWLMAVAGAWGLLGTAFAMRKDSLVGHWQSPGAFGFRG